MTVNLKAYETKWLRLALGCIGVFGLLLGAEYGRAETGFLALAVEATPAEVSESKLIIPDLNSLWNVDSIRAQKEKSRYRYSKPSNQNMYFSAGNAFVLPLRSEYSTGSGPLRSEASESPLGQFMFMVIIVSLGGMILILLGMLQIRRRRRVKNIRLFSATEISSHPIPVADSWDKSFENENRTKFSTTKQTDDKFARGRAA
jgi:hypothetical protein